MGIMAKKYGFLANFHYKQVFFKKKFDKFSKHLKIHVYHQHI
jgi:hypothetical protein